METDRIHVLDGLRAFAVVEVVAYHCCVPLCGQYVTRLAITLLFVLSGFLMRWHHRHDAGTVAAFVWPRVRRTLPLYWLTLAVLLACSSWGWRWDLPLHVALLQSWIPDSYYCFSYNGVAWFLSTLVALYAAFVPLNRLLNRLSPLWRITSLVTVVAVYFVTSALLNPPGDYFYYIFPIARVVDFMMGMVLCDVSRHLRTNPQAKRMGAVEVTTFEVAALLLAFLALNARHCVPWSLQAVRYTLLWQVPVLTLLLALTVPHEGRGLLSRLLSCRPLRRIGRLSLEIFLLQYLVISATGKAEAALGLTLPAVAHGALCVGAACALATLAHRARAALSLLSRKSSPRP